MLLGIFTFLLFLAYTFRPITTVSSEDCLTASGKIVLFEQSSSNDFNIRLDNFPDQYFYLNRAVEAGLNFEEMEKLILNREVTLWYVDRGGLFNINKKTLHVSRLMQDQTVLFNEIID